MSARLSQISSCRQLRLPENVVLGVSLGGGAFCHVFCCSSLFAGFSVACAVVDRLVVTLISGVMQVIIRLWDVRSCVYSLERTIHLLPLSSELFVHP